jgi:hypothetical protein
MSEILSNIVVQQIEATFQPEVSDISITPNAINLNIFTGSAPIAAGSNTDVQFNFNGALFGSNAFTFNNSTNTVTVDNFVASDNANLGDASNVTILGGVNGYFLQTDGTGNLGWSAAGNGGGNGTPGGSNTQIQYNDAGSFGGNIGFTFNEVTGNVAIPGNLIVSGTVTGTLTTNAQPNITSVGTLTSLIVSGTTNSAAVTTGFITLNGNMNSNGTVTANLFNGSGANLTNIPGANVTGTVANATYANSANLANTVTVNAQPNITSVGTLTSLSVSGNLSSGNANLGNLAIANFFSGDGSLLTNIGAALLSNGNSNVSIPVANGNITFNVAGNANVANISGTTLTTKQFRLLSNSVVLGNGAATYTGDTQPAVIIGAGAGNSANNTNRIAIGSGAGNAAGGEGTVQIGVSAGANSSGQNGVALGFGAGKNVSANLTTFIGYNAGSSGTGNVWVIGLGAEAKQANAGNASIGIGRLAGANGDLGDAIAIGRQAAYLGSQGLGAVAVGSYAAQSPQGNGSIAIGYYAAGTGNTANAQGGNSIAIGWEAGIEKQGANAIAIGGRAGKLNQHTNTIIVHAGNAVTGLDSTQANSLFVKPIRDVTGNVDFTVQLYYNPTTGEIGYK